MKRQDDLWIDDIIYIKNNEGNFVVDHACILDDDDLLELKFRCHKECDYHSDENPVLSSAENVEIAIWLKGNQRNSNLWWEPGDKKMTDEYVTTHYVKREDLIFKHEFGKPSVLLEKKEVYKTLYDDINERWSY